MRGCRQRLVEGSLEYPSSLSKVQFELRFSVPWPFRYFVLHSNDFLFRIYCFLAYWNGNFIFFGLIAPSYEILNHCRFLLVNYANVSVFTAFVCCLCAYNPHIGTLGSHCLARADSSDPSFNEKQAFGDTGTALDGREAGNADPTPGFTYLGCYTWVRTNMAFWALLTDNLGIRSLVGHCLDLYWTMSTWLPRGVLLFATVRDMYWPERNFQVGESMVQKDFIDRC